MGGRSSLYVTTLLSLITIGAITWPEVTTSLNGPVTLRGEYCYEENYFYGENTDSAVLSKATILKSCWCKKKEKKKDVV